ncbi:hypothetical protein, partial [Gallibacterium genomosp. 2]|uniref:hypothetical protein n=1 Tax=Gallibacterium genomosp. 2 TaxID=155517 RepID=UPI00057D9003
MLRGNINSKSVAVYGDSYTSVKNHFILESGNVGSIKIDEYTDLTILGGTVDNFDTDDEGIGDLVIAGGNIKNGVSLAYGVNSVTMTGGEINRYGLSVFGGGDLTMMGGSIKGVIGLHIGNGKAGGITTIGGNATVTAIPGMAGPASSGEAVGAVVFSFMDVEGDRWTSYKPQRQTLKLMRSPEGIEGIIFSISNIDLSNITLWNTNTLMLSGENILSLHLGELGDITKDIKINDPFSVTYSTGKKFFAFDTIEKTGTGTWSLTGTLNKDIITGYIDDKGIHRPGLSINEGKIALAPNTIVHTDIVVNPNGTLYSQAGGKQLVDSLTIKGTYQVDVNSHSDYSQLHSAKDIVIDDGSKLYVYADKLQGGDDTFLNVLSTDGVLKGRFNPKIEDNQTV